MVKFCPNCGINTNPRDTVCPSCGVNLYANNNQPQSFCTNCGTAINPNSSQCPRCGTYTNSGQPGQKKKSNGCIIALIGFAVIGFIMICVIGFLAALALPNFERARDEARRKACFSNQRVLMGGVEMYNMDVKEENMMHNLNIDILVKERYVKEKPKLPDPKCSYVSEGDLAKDGNVKCTYHGSVFYSR